MAQTTKSPQEKDASPDSDTWSELKIAWKSYKIARMKEDKAKTIKNAHKIQALQQILGAKQSKFPELIS